MLVSRYLSTYVAAMAFHDESKRMNTWAPSLDERGRAIPSIEKFCTYLLSKQDLIKIGCDRAVFKDKPVTFSLKIRENLQEGSRQTNYLISHHFF